MSSAPSANLGTLNVEPIFSASSTLPSIIFEWVALIPLVIYLSTYRHSYKLVGRSALGCSLGVTLFPKLGILSSIADLLEQGSEYLDRACSMSELRKDVWDANFGGRFPCANGAASEIITSSIMQHASKTITMPGTRSADTLRILPHRKRAEVAVSNSDELPQFRRYQTLHILHCSHHRSAPALSHRVFKFFTHQVSQIAIIFVLLGGFVVSCLFGLYGTGAAVLSSALFHLCRQFIHINRPDTYLLNNEVDHSSGCMLAGIHSNASTWYLYTGDRGIIDSLLNKPMILSITTSRYVNTKYLASFLRLLALLQLVSMTFVAAQKGWDGIGMLVLVILAWLSDIVVYGENQLTKRWLFSAGIEIKTKRFQFSGRATMIGAIQIFKKNPVEGWMDEILAPSDRRKLWLERLQSNDSTPETKIREASLSISDQEWVERNLVFARQAAEILLGEFPTV
ncbi:hypothetical protein BGZ57DRAFT_804837 [Hyaloscypha finlandica]|nr:hypothetical protein BGZ57DRAFT_804837 [Hyaloscypha finlandica]